MLELKDKYLDNWFEIKIKGALNSPGPNDCLGTGLLPSFKNASFRLPFNWLL